MRLPTPGDVAVRRSKLRLYLSARHRHAPRSLHRRSLAVDARRVILQLRAAAVLLETQPFGWRRAFVHHVLLKIWHRGRP